ERIEAQQPVRLPALVPQLVPSAGMPERQAVHRRTARVMEMLDTLPLPAQEAISDSLTSAGRGGRPPQTPPSGAGRGGRPPQTPPSVAGRGGGPRGAGGRGPGRGARPASR